MLPWMNCMDKYVEKIISSKHASAAAVFYRLTQDQHFAQGTGRLYT